jgi:hypothetical protein
MDSVSPVVKRAGLILALVASFMFIGGFLATQLSNGDASSQTLQAEASVSPSSSSSLLYFTVENTYTRLLGPIGRQYPWVNGSQILIDVHREATFTVVDEAQREGDMYKWSVDGVSFSGTSFNHTFRATGDHTVILRKISVSESSVTVFSGKVNAKYVRREVRELTDEDREAFLSTLAVLYNLNQDEGEKKYGSDYISMDNLVLVHLELAGNRTCDHLHDGMGFLTSHSALTMMMEKSLQAVNPAITVPYWDFSIEGELMSQNDGDISYMEDSVVFSDDWFGELWPEGGVINKGRWAYTKIAEVDKTQFSIYSPYGLARSPWNANPIPYLTRFSDFYGTTFTVMGSCQDHYNEMTATSLYDFIYNMQYNPHGVVHAVMGGVTNSDIYGTLRKAGVSVLSSDSIAATTFAFQKNMWRFGTYECPSDCDEKGLAPEDCACSCPSLADWKAKGLVAQQVGMLGPDMGSMLVSKVTGEDVSEIFLDALCNANSSVSSPYIGDMLESGSPADPLFWPIHPTVERLVMRWAMTGDRDNTWVDGTSTTLRGFFTGNCEGHNAADEIFFFNRFKKSESYTNVEYYDMISPYDDNIDYVYHHFLWEHCTSLPVDFTPDEAYIQDTSRNDVMRK